jgi:hypothetical protein
MKYFANLAELYAKITKSVYKDGRRKKVKFSKSGSILSNKFASWKTPLRPKKYENNSTDKR